MYKHLHLVLTFLLIICGRSVAIAQLFILDGSTKEIKVFDGATVTTVIPNPMGVDRTEIAVDTTLNKLYWSEVDKLLRSDLDGMNVETVVTGLDLAIALDVNTTTGQIYWLDWGANGSFPSATGVLERAEFDGSGITTLVTGLGLPQGLRLDVAGGKMYFGDRNGGDPLRRADLDGGAVEIIVPSAFAHHIALDLVTRQVYWSRGGAGNVFRSGLDGNSPLPVTSGFTAAAGVAVDPPGSQIFWSDQIAQNVYAADLDGANDAVLIPGLYAAGLVFVAAEPPDTAPPVVACAVAADMLWPPDHKLIDVGLDLLVEDDTDPDPVIEVLVYSDEDDEEPTGSGNHSPDSKDDRGTLYLRAERNRNGDGRVYLIVIIATDDSGNKGFTCCTVVVPKSKSKKGIADVDAQAAAAELYCLEFGEEPPGFVLVGDGPIIGPKQ